MIHSNYLRKLISVVLILVFIFHMDLFLNPQAQDVRLKEFRKAKDAYINGRYVNSRNRLERLIGIIIEKELELEKKDILGKCYLLLGAISEKENKPILAEENYKRAKEDYGIHTVDGIDLESLAIYRKIVKGEKEPPKGKIEKEIEKTKKKKKFPWLLVAGVAVAVVAAVILLAKKKKENEENEENEYTVRVELGEGVEGSPADGTYTYTEGSIVNYDYNLMNGYDNLVVSIDGTESSSSGTITMNSNHRLTATASSNEVNFVTNIDEIEVPEGGNASFNVRLSAQPTDSVNVTVSWESGDSDISVQSGGSLTFTTTDWNVDQVVTLHAAEDDDRINGSATIGISAAGITQKNITAKEDDDNPGEDNPPTVKITKPKDGAVVSGTTTIIAEATDDKGIDRVVFEMGKLTRTVNLPIPTDPNVYKYEWDTTAPEFEDADYQIIVTAYDTLNKGAKASITVTVFNDKN